MSDIKNKVDINSFGSYKKCRKKQYDIHVCKPPADTIVINKLEQYDVVKALGGRTYFTVATLEKMQQSNPQMFNAIKGYIQQGKCYVVSDRTPFVLAGTLGELWCIDKAKLMQCYGFIINNSLCRISDAVLKERSKDKNGEFLDWTVVRTVPDNSEAFACFVPSTQKGQLQTSWGAILNYNGQGVAHGKGDFIIAGNAGGQPNLSDRYVVNGNVFATTYNNQGWTDCLDSKYTGNSTLGSKVISGLPNLISETRLNSVVNEELTSYTEGIIKRCCQTQHTELPMAYKRLDSNSDYDCFEIKAKVVNDYVDKFQQNSARSGEIYSHIKIYKNNMISVRVMNKGDNGKHRNLTFVLPNRVKKTDNVDIDVIKKLLDSGYTYIFGLCGYVKQVGVQGSFQTLAPYTKQDYDGIRDYTKTSGVVNNYLRGININKMTKEEKAVGARNTVHADSYFDKTASCRALQVFRGQPYAGVFENLTLKGQNNDFTNLEGVKVVNTAYTSTTLSLNSSLSFAMSKADDKGNKGIVYFIDLPEGIKAGYVHNVAGWKQQFEILLDRLYDLLITEELLEFISQKEDGSPYYYKLVKAKLVQHADFGPLDEVQSDLLYKAGFEKYEFGKVPVRKQYYEGVLHHAFNIIQEKGFSDVQWSERTSTGKIGFKNNFRDVELDDMIILRTKDVDKLGRRKDVGFCLEDNTLVVKPVSVNKNLRADLKSAEDLRRTEYELNYGLQELDWSKKPKNFISPIDWDFNSFFNEDTYEIIPLVKLDEHEIAGKIIDYAKTHKNMCLLPLIDVARYFDICFSQAITSEGYELQRSIRVERKVKSESQRNDPQAGFCPCKYQINGDNDDHLVIDVRFYRDKTSQKLMFDYRGQSQGTKVSDSKSLSFDVFNNDIMHQIALNIIYTFETKMHLSKTRKVDKLFEYFSHQTGCHVSYQIKQDANSLKQYKVWTKQKDDFVIIDCDRVDYDRFILILKSNNHNNTDKVEVDSKNNIMFLYKNFRIKFEEVTGQ